MVESILIFSLMIMLLAAIPTLAKRQDVKQTAIDANRYASWQMTVSSAVDRELLIDRFFSASDAPIRSAQAESGLNTFWATANAPLVRDHGFKSALTDNIGPRSAVGASSLVDKRSVSVHVAERAASSGLVSDAITGTVRTVSDWMGSADAIAPNRGIVQTALSVGMNGDSRGAAGAPGPDCTGEGSKACVSVHSALLVDGWEAANDEHIREGAQIMVPSELLTPLGEVLDAVSVVPLLAEFEDMDANFGCINTSLLPTQELSGTLSDTTGTPHDC